MDMSMSRRDERRPEHQTDKRALAGQRPQKREPSPSPLERRDAPPAVHSRP